MSRLLLLAPSAYTLGGLATWLDYLDPGLSARGWEVTVGLVGGASHHRPERYLAAHPHRRWIAVSCPTGTPEGRCRAVLRAFRRAGPDLVAAVNVPDAYPAVMRARARDARSAPRVTMTIHAIQADLFDDVRRYSGVLDGVVCTNRLTARLAETVGGMAPERVHYAPYGTEGARDDGREETSPGEKLRLAFVGRLDRGEKRVQDLAGVLEQLEQRSIPFELVLAGDGPDEPYLRQALARWTASGDVHFLGRLSPEEVRARVYARADALLLTSPCETGPQVLWEAMAAGVPVVSSRYLGSTREGALEHGRNALLFPVGDTARAAEHLARLRNDREQARSMAAAARAMVGRRYSQEVSIAAWDRALRQILEAPPRPPGAAEVPTSGGNLDRWLGPGLAESVRGLVGRRFPAADPSAEWPHTHSSVEPEEASFWRMVRAEEAAVDGTVAASP